MAKRKKKASSTNSKSPTPQKTVAPVPPVEKSPVQVQSTEKKSFTPVISVIVSMYNAEKYIGACLDSILEQTFQDFEVIVVDDCSTDKSVQIVSNYALKFNGRLNLARTVKKSGISGVLRNIGFRMAKYEYIYFVNAEDFIAKNALETLHCAAKEYDADVVYNSCYYGLESADESKIVRDNASTEEEKPILIADDGEKLLRESILKNYDSAPWLKFVRREFLKENNILFPKLAVGGDNLWTMLLFANSKRFLRLPVPIYYSRRHHDDFIAETSTPTAEYDPNSISAFVKWFKTLNESTKNGNFSKETIELCFQATTEYYSDYFSESLDAEKKLQCFNDVKDILQRELPADEENADTLANSFLKFVDEQRKAAETLLPPTIPAISVIISLYNYENYIGECLESLLAQKFQDFEVIVVDDCSTDKSVEVVENYMPKFDGRLKLTKTESNTGGGGIPRNIGLEMSRGEYIFFMDADDALTTTGLEEMYTCAKNFEADVVYCEKYFISEGVGEDFLKNVHAPTEKRQKPPFVEEPTLEPEDLGIRIDRAINFRYWLTAWLRFVRRELLIENKIVFSSLIGSNDVGWTFKVLFSAKKFLRVPNTCYIRRIHDKSVSFRERTPVEQVHKWMDRTIRSLKDMDNFMKRIPFLKAKIWQRFKVINFFMQTDFEHIEEKCGNLPKSAVYRMFLQKFGKYLGEYDVLVSALCADINTKRRRIKNINRQVAELAGMINFLESKKIPAVSVVIPMYNAEKFIGECLDSLLAQTFKDFEVIVVDDCSTDNSVPVVESYAPRFNGRLRISSTKKNSGGGGYVPRNLGLKLSHGEYIFFLDADDFILSTALETLYNAAKEFDADVVYNCAYYELANPNEPKLVQDSGEDDLIKKSLEGETVLVTDEPDKNLRSLLLDNNMPASWKKFVRREFLIENGIFFPEIMNGGDFIWSINLCCHAKRFLRLPNPIYYYRSYNTESVLRKKRKPAEQISHWMAAFIAWAKALRDLSNEVEILKNNHDYCHDALNLKFKWCIGHIPIDLKSLAVKDIYGILYREFSKGEDLSDSALSFIFIDLFINRRMVVKYRQRITELENKVKQLTSKG